MIRLIRSILAATAATLVIALLVPLNSAWANASGGDNVSWIAGAPTSQFAPLANKLNSTGCMSFRIGYVRDTTLDTPGPDGPSAPTYAIQMFNEEKNKVVWQSDQTFTGTTSFGSDANLVAMTNVRSVDRKVQSTLHYWTYTPFTAWQSDTHSGPGSIGLPTLVLDSTGNLKILDGNGFTIWQTGTHC